MAFREAVLHGSTAREHIVQLFDTVASLGETVATFVTEGLAADDIVLVVARPHAWTNVAACLDQSGVDVARAVDRRQLVVLDAATTLSEFTRQRWPDSERFETVIGGLVRELA